MKAEAAEIRIIVLPVLLVAEGEAMNTIDVPVLVDLDLLLVAHDDDALVLAFLRDALPLVFYTYLLTQGTAMACGRVFYNTYIVALTKWGKPPYRQYDPAHNARYNLFFWRHNRLYKTLQ